MVCLHWGSTCSSGVGRSGRGPLLPRTNRKPGTAAFLHGIVICLCRLGSRWSNSLLSGPGTEVILPTWTWFSCYNAIIATGATPVFAEIDESLNIDPADIERHIIPHTRIIIVVHIMGEPADTDPILAIAWPASSEGT